VDLQVPSATLAALLLATVRASGFVVMAPPFNSAGIPVAVKGALAMALAVVVFPHIVGGLPAITAGFLIVSAITEAIIGAALGFIVQVLFTAVQLAGDIIDVTGGFSLQPAGRRRPRPALPGGTGAEHLRLRIPGQDHADADPAGPHLPAAAAGAGRADAHRHPRDDRPPERMSGQGRAGR
jgi:hypothetical protein